MFSQRLAMYEQMGQRSEWIASQGFYGVALVMTGNYAQGLAAVQRTHAWAKERNALTEIAQCNFYLNVAYIEGGYLDDAREAARRATEAFEQLGNRLYVYVGSFHQSWAAVRAGQYESAAAYAARAQESARKLGGRLVHADDLAAVHAAIAFGQGRVQEAIELSERAVGIAQEMRGTFAEGKARRTWGQALAALVPPHWDEAEAQMAHSLRLFEAGENRLEAARSHEAWGAVCRARGDFAAARAHWTQAAAQWEASGLDHELARVHTLIESLAFT
jgi:tetratricopeptide (TPR) repeat protein